MSIANLEQPNDLNLYCNELTANTLNVDTENITNLTTVNITSTGLITAHNITANGVINAPQANLTSLTMTNGSIISNVNSATSLSASNTVNPMISSLLALNSGPDTVGNVPIMNITSQQPNSSISMNNTNAGASSNGIVFYDNNGNPVMQVGSNNTPGNEYILTGLGKDLVIATNNTEQYRIAGSGSVGSIASLTPLNISFPQYLQQTWSTITIGTTPQIPFSYDTTTNQSYTFYSVVEGFTTAGTTGATQSVVIHGLFKNIAGTASLVGQNTVSTLSDIGFVSVVTYSTSGSSTIAAELAITGATGQTIHWTGYTIVTATI